MPCHLQAARGNPLAISLIAYTFISSITVGHVRRKINRADSEAIGYIIFHTEVSIILRLMFFIAVDIVAVLHATWSSLRYAVECGFSSKLSLAKRLREAAACIHVGGAWVAHRA